MEDRLSGGPVRSIRANFEGAAACRHLRGFVWADRGNRGPAGASGLRQDDAAGV